MINLIKHFSKTGDVDAVPFRPYKGSVTYQTRLRTDFKYSGLNFSRNYVVRDKFTLLGDVDLAVVPTATMLEGIDQKYLTVDGGVNLDNVMNELKINTGLPQGTLIGHAAHVQEWKWYDNHVHLLMNMLRMYYITTTAVEGKLYTGSDKVYADGHVIMEVSMGRQMPDDFDNIKWPGRRDDRNYPTYAPSAEALPNVELPTIDIRPLTYHEARFVLMMTAAWVPQTKMSMDFASPKLCDMLSYRYRHNISEIDAWLENDDVSINSVVTADIMWSALVRYVTHNKLYNQFSVASNLLAQLMLRPDGDTAEAQVWHTLVPQLNIPKFGSVRGRYPFLLDGEGAFLQARAIEDWSYISTKPEVLTTYSMYISSAMVNGYALRMFRETVRNGRIEDWFSNDAYMDPDTSYVSAAADFLGIDVPLNGLAGVNVFYNQLSMGVIMARLPVKEYDGKGYNVINGELVIESLPFVGTPYLYYPCSPFAEETPYNGVFSLPKPIAFRRHGAIYTSMDAWKIAWAARVAGYDTEVQEMSTMYGKTKFYASNDNSWTHPIYDWVDVNDDRVYLKVIERRQHHFVELPLIMLPGMYTDVLVSTHVIDTGTIDADNRLVRTINTASHRVMPQSSRIQVITSGEMTRYWGFVSRTGAGLMIVEPPTPAVVPRETNLPVQVELPLQEELGAVAEE